MAMMLEGIRDIYMAGNRGSGWAIVMAPCPGGWKVRYLRGGAQLADGGGTCESLEEALMDIQALARLLEEDALTVELFLGKKADT